MSSQTVEPETLYADDPDVNRRYIITDRMGQLVTFTPVVTVAGHPDINAAWEGDPAIARVLRVPLTGLPAGTHVLRLLVPGDNDVKLPPVYLW